ncbi:MAG: 16S rRNA (guanine(527)-N(7))-methyltransferase RsmG [Thermoanaerobaculales bacterium]|nr:16S rRNA (guanine(527)-N(7))-methyltransferase RsmG [Thermoanaerobaculales bacterium]
MTLPPQPPLYPAAERDLETGARTLGTPLGGETAARLLAYAALLIRWNRAYNLTAIRDPRAILARHLLDSLSILPWVRGPRLLDVGTGPGLPGIPLALADPGLSVTLLDANGKKVRFCRQCVIELGLTNVEVVQARVESYRPARGFDSVTTRAFADLHEVVRSCLVPGVDEERHLVQVCPRDP